MEKKNQSETILVICMGLLIFFVLFQIKLLLYLSLIIGMLGIFSDYLASKIEWLWLKLAMILGVINGKILLSAIFFTILTPISLFMKIIGKTPIQLNKSTKNSMFTVREHTYKPDDLKDIW